MKRLLSFLLLFLPIFLIVILLWSGMAKIDTDISSLLPLNTKNNQIFQAVENAQNRQLNETVIVMVGASDSEQAFDNAKQIAQLWRESGLFRNIDDTVSFNIDDIIKTNQELNLALLSKQQAQLLLNNPDEYFKERVEDLLNPFSGSLIAVSDDYLGFSRFLSQKQGVAKLELSIQHNMLFSQQDNQTWVWVRATPNNQAISKIMPLVEKTQQFAQKQGVSLAMAGGLLFAADSKQQAEHESKIISIIGITLTFGFLLWAFRTPRILALLLVLAVGLSTGLAVSLSVFQTVHILTLVVGTSLVGVLVDFPLHWLSSSLFRQPEQWNAHATLKKLLPTFLISLCITATGYLLLLFAPLPLLRQTAIFSITALIGALLTTVLILPKFFNNYQQDKTKFANCAEYIYKIGKNISNKVLITVCIILILFLSFGIINSKWQDDIRQWIILRDNLLQQTIKIAQISGIEQSGQNIIIQAHSEDELLKTSENISNKIQAFANAKGLHEWILPTDTQRQLKHHLQKILQQKQEFIIMTTAGIPPQIVHNAIDNTVQMPDISLSGSLKYPIATAWQNLYIGKIDNQYIGLLQLSDIKNITEIKKIIDNQPCTKTACVYFYDKRNELNQQFNQIRTQTIILKIISFILALVVLSLLFGIRKSVQIITIPTLAVLVTIGILGWLNISIGLFATFGLLLSSAVGVDYTVYAINAQEPTTVKISGVLLAAITTSLSFGLLSLSSTPAVATFGISIAIAVILNCLMTLCLIVKR